MSFFQKTYILQRFWSFFLPRFFVYFFLKNHQIAPSVLHFKGAKSFKTPFQPCFSSISPKRIHFGHKWEVNFITQFKKKQNIICFRLKQTVFMALLYNFTCKWAKIQIGRTNYVQKNSRFTRRQGFNANTAGKNTRNVSNGILKIWDRRERYPHRNSHLLGEILWNKRGLSSWSDGRSQTISVRNIREKKPKNNSVIYIFFAKKE